MERSRGCWLLVVEYSIPNIMFSLRREISDYARACEHLIIAAKAPDAVPFAHEELEWISYYATEMANLAEQRVRIRRPHAIHKRQTLAEYAVTSQALFLADGFSEGERERIRQLVSEVMREILGK
ncbi:MAG: hypothetical protein QM706_03540 [Nitrospira sp.]